MGQAILLLAVILMHEVYEIYEVLIVLWLLKAPYKRHKELFKSLLILKES